MTLPEHLDPETTEPQEWEPWKDEDWWHALDVQRPADFDDEERRP